MELKKEKCIASQLQNACKKINGTEPKFKDELELKRKMNCSFPRENGIYWTALRYEKVYYKKKKGEHVTNDKLPVYHYQ